LILRLRAHDDTIKVIDCSADGKLVLTGGWDFKIKIWSMSQFEKGNKIDNTNGQIV
jgi:WD40 repeat protein